MPQGVQLKTLALNASFVVLPLYLCTSFYKVIVAMLKKKKTSDAIVTIDIKYLLLLIKLIHTLNS